jgi:hypothetical protein
MGMEGCYPEPLTLAEMARSALMSASVATVVSDVQDATVKVTADRYGRPILYLPPESPLVEQLEASPRVAVTVAATDPFEALELRGPVRRVKAAHDERRLLYRMALLKVAFVRPRRAPVRLAAFHAAQPDMLWGHAQQMLDHLSAGHSAELTACVRAHGLPDADMVVARSIDRRGIELAVLSEDGVSAVWMPFLNGPVTNPSELAWQVKLCLTCRCRNNHAHEATE